MKKFHILLLIVTAISGFISCDIRSELVDPLGYSDTLYVYHKDTVYISSTDTLYAGCNCDGTGNGGSDTGSGENQDSPATPVIPTPVETKTIIVEFTEQNEYQPFMSNLPGSEKLADKWSPYTLKETDYNFEFYAPVEGKGYGRFAVTKSGTEEPCYALRVEGAYMKLPSIADYQLHKVEVTGGNTSGNKTYRIYDKVSETPKEAPRDSLIVNGLGTKSLLFSDKATSVGVSYIISGFGSNAQFQKLVLTYGKFE